MNERRGEDETLPGFEEVKEGASAERQRGKHDDAHARSELVPPGGDIVGTVGTSAGSNHVGPTAPGSPGNSDSDCICLCRHSDHHLRNGCCCDLVHGLHSDSYHHDDCSPNRECVQDPRIQGDFQV